MQFDYVSTKNRLFSLASSDFEENWGYRKRCTCNTNDCSSDSCICFQINKASIVCLYYCFEGCNCDESCKLRLKKSFEDKLEVFNTKDGRNKGVKLKENIEKNTFLIEYVGEVLTKEEVIVNRKKYLKRSSANYIFSLNEIITIDNKSETLYTAIDATEVGNIARFINHSCEPNCEVRVIRLKSLRFGHLCIFSKRKLSAEEEITISYGSSIKPHPNSTVCLCKTENCKGVLPFDISPSQN